MWTVIPNSIKELHQLFKNADRSLFIVGGAVRDFLNKESPKDYDLATEATPEEVLHITRDFKNHFHGKSFGVVVVYTDDNPEGFEIATFREDVYGSKLGETRNPDVKFSTIDKDVLRRDITYNALFFDLNKQEIIDLVGGIKDIENRITRFVGDPILRIEEDPLRILRLLRFAVRYGFEIEAKSHAAIAFNVDKLSILTKEGIWKEIKKAFKQCKDFKRYMRLLIEYGIAFTIFHDLDKMNCIISECSTLELFFANLFKTNSTEGLLDTMKFEFKMEHDFSRKVVFFIDLLNLSAENSLEVFKKREICKVSTDELLEWFTITGLRKSAVHRAFLYFKPTIKATDLIAKGFKNKALGFEIKRLEIQNFNELIDATS